MTAREFPFIGAGEAGYFEWAEVHVRFEREPTAAERAAIAKAVPPPIADLAWHGPLLVASSEQGVGRQIKAAYGAKKKTGAKPLVAQNRFAQASVSADARFNAHIEEWLTAAHANVPILVAHRRQDLEAGGTKLSDWHRTSMRDVPRVLGALVDAARTEDARLAARIAAWAKEESVDVAPDVARKVAALEQAEKQAREDAAEARWEQKATAHATSVAELDAATKDTKLSAVSAAEAASAIASLAKAMPAVAKRLAKVDPKELRLRKGAAKAALAAAEKAMGTKLIPEHAALLSAFDGGRVGEIVFPGTPAGGGRGREDVVAASLVFGGHEGKAWTVTVAILADGTLVKARLEGGKAEVHHQEGESGQILKLSKKLDTLLDALMKAKRG